MEGLILAVVLWIGSCAIIFGAILYIRLRTGKREDPCEKELYNPNDGFVLSKVEGVKNWYLQVIEEDDQEKKYLYRVNSQNMKDVQTFLTENVFSIHPKEKITCNLLYLSTENNEAVQHL